MAKNGKHLEVRLGEDLPPQHLQRLIAQSKAYTEQVNRNRIVYPDPDAVDLDSAEAEFEIDPQGFLSNDIGKRIRNKRKSQKGGGGGSKPKLPNPQVVLAEVQKTFANLPVASTKGNLQFLEFNAEFGDASKAKYFKDVYIEMFTRGHLIFLSEVDAAFVSAVAGYCNYTGYCSTANTRGQAVAFLVHPRFKLVGQPVEYQQVATVQGIPDLRPAYLLELEDTTTGVKAKYVVLHLKSMRGGPKVTAAVRYKQMQILEQLLGQSFDGLVAGDMNFILSDPKVTDGDPLKNSGYTLIAAGDSTPTQSMGSRIDGFFGKGTGGNVSFYQVRAYWKNPQITRAFSDHALTSVQKVICDPKHQLGAKPNAGCTGGLGDDDFPVDANGAFSGSADQDLKLVDVDELVSRAGK
ncbi:MAG: endonuclease/exonuclease/phosphatase family protein [Candidatus Obscuribacterales bacterium]|nr:endonuclease/exonuclease/phosphatase family protein [Candidatus Obscuribacterales bacterium]